MYMWPLVHEMTSGTNYLDWQLQKRKLVVVHWLSVLMRIGWWHVFILLSRRYLRKYLARPSVFTNSDCGGWSWIHEVHLTKVNAIWPKLDNKHNHITNNFTLLPWFPFLSHSTTRAHELKTSKACPNYTTDVTADSCTEIRH